MTYRIIIEPTAEQGIRAAVRWKTENASPAVAGRWYNSVLKKIRTLRTHPARCPLAFENDRFPIEIRELLHGRHRDVFRIIFTIQNDSVLILYVRHSAQQELEP